MTAREYPRLVLVTPEPDADGLLVQAPLTTLARLPAVGRQDVVRDQPHPGFPGAALHLGDQIEIVEQVQTDEPLRSCAGGLREVGGKFSVRVFVILFEARLVSVWMGVGLPLVAVFVLVFDVVVVVQDVGMRMRHILVSVLMGVRCGHHSCSVPGRFPPARSTLVSGLIGPCSIDATRLARTVGTCSLSCN